ncbi:uncharacterized protein LOC143041061 [Oratosquilla oratoria]|uniref:uncharacterized protein LOC143041061 n=1 Tax=Oratosquilla oratoria TaxID=337810 RepID=UPI003F75AB80
MYIMSLWQHIFVVCCVLVGMVQPRHVPLSNYEVDWVNYVRSPNQLRDARVIYTIFKNDVAKQHVRRDLESVTPEEEDILEVLTNSKENGNFTGYQHPFYYMMDPTTRNSNLFLPVPTQRPSVIPARHYVKAIKSLTRDVN